MAKRAKKRTKKHKKAKPKISLKYVIIGIVVVLVLLIVAVKLALPKNVIAKVNGEKIHLSELEFKYGLVPEDLRAALSPGDFLDALIDETILLQKAKTQDITATKEEVDVFISATIVQSGIPEDIFYEQAEARGVSKEALLKAFESRYIINKFFDATLEIEVSEDELKAFYDQNKDQLISPERVNARHILVNTKEEADQVRNQLLEGADFETLAKEKSIEPAAAQTGGNLGWFNRGQMVASFEYAAFSLRVGKISQPIQTQFGWHIIEVLDKKNEASMGLDEIKEDIRNILSVNKKEQAIQDYLSKLKDAAEIEKISAEELTALLQQ